MSTESIKIKIAKNTLKVLATLSYFFLQCLLLLLLFGFLGSIIYGIGCILIFALKHWSFTCYALVGIVASIILYALYDIGRELLKSAIKETRKIGIYDKIDNMFVKKEK